MPSQIYRNAGRCLDLKNTHVYYCPVGFKIRNLKFLIIGTPSRSQQSIVCQDREKNLAQSFFFFCKMVGIDVTVQTNSGPIEGLHSKSSSGKGLLFLWVKVPSEECWFAYSSKLTGSIDQIQRTK